MRHITMLSTAFSISLLLAISACNSTTTKSASRPAQSDSNQSAQPAQQSSLNSNIGKASDYNPSAITAVEQDPKTEKRIREILKKMTLGQKVGQMIQVKIGQATPQEITEYGIGSILNGGGQTPNDKADSTPKQWADYADEMYQASISKAHGNPGIPLIWGTDAVHGHNNVRGAVLYPHNIGLGAANNPELVKQISEATALSVAATGIDWNFAPTVATARDYRWGRTYESFSEDPKRVSVLGAKVVEGLQGSANTPDFLDQNHVIATAKHFIGDGGTAFGDDQGYTDGLNDALLPIHLPGYISTLESGVQSVMASYNFWNGIHSHANKAMLIDLLKTQLKFDGIVVSDWQAIAHIPGCSLDSCPEAINAGVDIFMIPNAPDWQNFYTNTIKQVNNGEIPLARVDDAVLRILRVKMRAGLWEKPSPARRINAGKDTIFDSKKNRDLARQAVRESLVLLKNNGLLPLSPKQRFLVTGNGADNISMQSGGWSVTWQGTDNSNDKYVGATSIFEGITKTVESAGGTVIFNETGDTNETVAAAFVIFGEPAYAEMYGDIQNLETLEFERKTKHSLKLIQKLKAKNIPVVAILLSGRPLWVNKELNASDSFISAWLPGTEGQGIADVMFLKADGKLNYDFKGKLSFSWPKKPCDANLNWGDQPYQPLFPLDYGLNYNTPIINWVTLDENTEQWKYGCRLGKVMPPAEKINFSTKNDWFFYAEKQSLTRTKIDKKVTLGAITGQPDSSLKGSVSIIWDGSEEGRVDLMNNNAKNEYLNVLANNGSVVFDIKIVELGSLPIEAVLFSGHLGGSKINLTPTLLQQPKNQWSSISIDLRCFSNIRADMNKITIPFGLHSKGKHQLSFGNVRYVPNKAASSTLKCQL